MQFISEQFGDIISLGEILSLEIEVPEDTVYRGNYKLDVIFTDTFPSDPPLILFKSIIYHCQIDQSTGRVQGSIFEDPKDNWADNMSLVWVLNKVYQLFSNILYEEPITIEEIYMFWSSEAPFMLNIPQSEQIVAAKQFQNNYMKKIRPLQQSALNDLMRDRKISSMNYEPLHPELFEENLKEEWIDPLFLDWIKTRDENLLENILTVEADHVFSFQLFSEEYCLMLIEELENYEKTDLPKKRPNTMNNYGLILDDIGMENVLDHVMHKYVSPLSGLLFPEWGGETLDRHHGFMVQYRVGEDVNLDMHIDDSEVTLNVSLGKVFDGGSLRFCGTVGEDEFMKLAKQYTHIPGRAVIHSGKHRHGAEDISSGERYNLILWCKSSLYRMSPASSSLERSQTELGADAICESISSAIGTPQLYDFAMQNVKRPDK
eukprot:TRINITY_DN2364_c0_g1_i1.p1 TRINITY_DN2364_c0_g1~~TRINITY_DN2364_c0_g1_i1.p1  ORF type:complete len:432 (-),score=97.19 TRINITY_DN2364_c0_g1_i1:48-1343(-)